jgi:hypothetical protein
VGLSETFQNRLYRLYRVWNIYFLERYKRFTGKALRNLETLAALHHMIDIRIDTAGVERMGIGRQFLHRVVRFKIRRRIGSGMVNMYLPLHHGILIKSLQIQSGTVKMIRLNDAIKLHAADKKRLVLLTGVAPALDDAGQYNDYLHQHIALHDQETAEASLLRSLLEDELIPQD